MLGIEKTRTSPYHAQSDGKVERLNRILKDQLTKHLYQWSWRTIPVSMTAHGFHAFLSCTWKGTSSACGHTDEL